MGAAAAAGFFAAEDFLAAGFFFGACSGLNVSRSVGGEFKALIRAPWRTDFFLGAAFFFACGNRDEQPGHAVAETLGSGHGREPGPS